MFGVGWVGKIFRLARAAKEYIVIAIVWWEKEGERPQPRYPSEEEGGGQCRGSRAERKGSGLR